jgi:hypothetical protein
MDEQMKSERVEKSRVESSIQAMNALSLGQLRAKTLDGRAFANIEEIQGEMQYKHLSMRSGSIAASRFQERFNQRRPLPPSTPDNAHRVDVAGGGKAPTADMLPQTPFNPYRQLTKGIHLAEEYVATDMAE